MKKLFILSAGFLMTAVLPMFAFADVSVRARIDTDDFITTNTQAERIRISTITPNVGVCGLAGFVSIRDDDGRLLCLYNIIRSSVAVAGSSPIGLHTSGSGCVGSTSNPLVVIDLVDDPGVTVTFIPGNGTPVFGNCGTFNKTSFTFCTEDNNANPACTPVDDFDLTIRAD